MRIHTILCSIILLLPFIAFAGDSAPKPGTPEWTRAQQKLRVQAEELSKKQMALDQAQIDVLKAQLKEMQKVNEDEKVIKAATAIIELKVAELQMKRAVADARTALEGAKLIADDGQYLGRIGPDYDTESIFCDFGAYGEDFSDKSIWCKTGKYGASYEQLSPFCSFSTKPPTLLVGGIPVASVTVGVFGKSAPLSPDLLKTLK